MHIYLSVYINLHQHTGRCHDVLFNIKREIVILKPSNLLYWPLLETDSKGHPDTNGVIEDSSSSER